MENETKKGGMLFGIINILDLLIVTGIIGVICIGVLYLSSGGFKKGEKVTVYYTVEIEGLKLGFLDLVKEGDLIKDSIRSFYLGEIYKVESVESFTWNLNEETREFVRYTVPNEEVLHITIKSEGYETDLKIVSEDNEVRVGKVMYLEGKGFVLSGYIIDLWTEPVGGK